jgi:hypothetical protein
MLASARHRAPATTMVRDADRVPLPPEDIEALTRERGVTKAARSTREREAAGQCRRG